MAIEPEAADLNLFKQICFSISARTMNWLYVGIEPDLLVFSTHNIDELCDRRVRPADTLLVVRFASNNHRFFEILNSRWPTLGSGTGWQIDLNVLASALVTVKRINEIPIDIEPTEYYTYVRACAAPKSEEADSAEPEEVVGTNLFRAMVARQLAPHERMDFDDAVAACIRPFESADVIRVPLDMAELLTFPRTTSNIIVVRLDVDGLGPIKYPLRDGHTNVSFTQFGKRRKKLNGAYQLELVPLAGCAQTAIRYQDTELNALTCIPSLLIWQRPNTPSVKEM